MPDPEKGNVQIVVRRRRTSRHRRNRRIRRWLAGAVIAVFTISVSLVALQYLSPSLFRAQSATPTVKLSELSHNRAVTLNEILSHAQPARPVYPYSVVAGGVEDAKELKWVAEHDPVVAAHYAGFDYERAQVVRLTLARTVYVSYRIGNNIYWTRRRLTLHKGEKLITDGRITARARCANRVEEAPQQQAAAPVEPPVQKFDEPVGAGEGTAIQSPPIAFESALLNRPGAPGLGPEGPLSLYDPFTGGSAMSISPPPLPVPAGLCVPVKKKGSSIEIESDAAGKKKKTGPCGSTETIPEPGTWLLFATGFAAIYWLARRRLSPA